MNKTAVFWMNDILNLNNVSRKKMNIFLNEYFATKNWKGSNFGQIKHIMDHWAFWIIFHQIFELKFLTSFWMNFLIGWIFQNSFWIEYWIESFLGPIQRLIEKLKRIEQG